MRLLHLTNLTPVSAKHFKMFGKRVGRTATGEEVKRCIVADSDTRAMDSSSSSTDVTRSIATDGENSGGQMDEDTSLRSPAVSHPLDPNADEKLYLAAHHKAGGDQERRSAQPALTCGVPWIRIPQCSKA